MLIIKNILLFFKLPRRPVRKSSLYCLDDFRFVVYVDIWCSPVKKLWLFQKLASSHVPFSLLDALSDDYSCPVSFFSFYFLKIRSIKYLLFIKKKYYFSSSHPLYLLSKCACVTAVPCSIIDWKNSQGLHLLLTSCSSQPWLVF